jgi:hypothetical protein
MAEKMLALRSGDGSSWGRSPSTVTGTRTSVGIFTGCSSPMIDDPSVVVARVVGSQLKVDISYNSKFKQWRCQSGRIQEWNHEFKNGPPEFVVRFVNRRYKTRRIRVVRHVLITPARARRGQQGAVHGATKCNQFNKQNL